MEKITIEGFTFEVNRAALDDFEFLELLADMEENPLKFPKVVEFMLGKPQKKEFLRHLRKQYGSAPATKVTEIIEQLFEAMGEEVKNS